jgi:hypothetical protein
VLLRELEGVSRWCFPQTVARLEAIGAAREWLREYPGIARRVRDAPITRGRLVVVPIWEHKALVAGWEFGTKLRTGYELIEGAEGNERLELDVREENVREPRLQERRFFQAACDLDALGATRPRFSGRELLVPLVAGAFEEPVTVLESQGDAAEMAEQGRRIALRPATGAGDPRTDLFVLRESLTLLYYPLWIVEYRAGGRPYRIVVDGRDGSVNSATAPAARNEWMVAAGAKTAALVIVAAFAVWLASVWSEARVPMAFAAAIVVISAVLVLVRSPVRGKVEYHEPFSS